MIDLVLVNKKYCRSVEDVTVRRRANIESDHNMLLIKMRLHLNGKKKKKPERVRRIDRGKLADTELVKEAREMIKTKLEEGKNDELALEDDWDRFKQTIREVSGGFHEDKKERSRKIYMSEGTRKILDEKRMTEIAFDGENSDVNRKRMKAMQRKLRRRLIRDREKWWKRKATEIEEHEEE